MKLSLFFLMKLQHTQKGLQFIHNVVMIWPYLSVILKSEQARYTHTQHFHSFNSLSIPFANNTQQKAPTARPGLSAVHLSPEETGTYCVFRKNRV